MSARQRMTMRAYLERNRETGSDRGSPLPPSFTREAIVPCYAWENSERSIEDGRKSVLVGELRAIVPRETDITEADRLESIRDRKESVLWPGRILIETIIRKPDHLLLSLKAVGGENC